EHLEFPVPGDEATQLSELLARTGIRFGAYVCIHPGARDRCKCWGTEKFAMAADAISRMGYLPVFTGTESERAIVQEVIGFTGCPSVDLCGKTRLGMLAALIRGSRMLLANDTGVSHMAAAVATPSVVVFVASEPLRWAPLDSNLHRSIGPERANDFRY